jgi:hypothetical protein
MTPTPSGGAVRRTTRTALAAATAVALGSALALTQASPASAGLGLTAADPVKHVMRTIGETAELREHRLPLIGGAPVGLPLTYHGGEVELTNRSFAIFWEPAGHASSPTYKPLVQRWFQDVGGSALFDTTTEYYQGSGSAQQYVRNVSSFGGSYVDATPFPAGGITDADVQAAVRRAVTANGWPVGIGNEFFVYSGPGGEIVSSYCAYHGSFTLNGQTALYADEPYGGQSGCTVPSSPNGDPAADSVINTTSHEQWETITDPVNAWYALDGDEGSDQCNFLFGPTDAGGADVRINGHGYIVQQEWRNSAAPFGCVMS